MANFAVLDGENIINTIVAESKAIAEEVTGKTCVEFSATDHAETGGMYTGGAFIPRKPYSSWVLNNLNEWEPPFARPDDEKNYEWNEQTVSWIEI